MDTLELNWLTSQDPIQVLRELPLSWSLSARRDRLIAVAFCRRIKGLFIEQGTHDAIGLLEQIADGEIANSELSRIANTVVEDWDVYEFTSAFDDAQRVAVQAVYDAICSETPAFSALQRTIEATTFRGTQATVIPSLANLIRDVAGNPFCPVTFATEWRTSTVTALAETIYADRTFGNLPVLADALEDAGCEHADILSHCRGPGPHVRGCWVVDLVLGKE